MTSQLADPNYAPHLSPQKGTSLKGLCAAWVTLTGITTILRFWSRATSPKNFGGDDWTALACWALLTTLDLLALEWTGAGLGLHITEVPLGDVRKGLKLLYASYIIYNLAITMARFSAILFYIRIFEPRNSPYRYFLWGGLGLNMAWILAFGTIAVVPCRPIHAFWDRALLPTSSYTCLSTLVVQMSAGITSVLMDLVVLLLPVPRLLKLQTTPRRKFQLMVIFLIGYCVIIFTIGRLVSIAKAGNKLNIDITWAFVTTVYWYTCELSVANISISLPTIVHLIKRLRHHGTASLLNAKEYPINSARSVRTNAAEEENGFVRLRNGTEELDIHLNTLETGIH